MIHCIIIKMLYLLLIFFQVHEHKVPGKESTILVGAALLEQCKQYALRVRPDKTSKYMFNTIQGRNKGQKMSESVSLLLASLYSVLL